MMDRERIDEIATALAHEAGALVVVVAPVDDGGWIRIMCSGVKMKGKEAAPIAIKTVGLLLGSPSVAAQKYAEGLSSLNAGQLLAMAVLEAVKPNNGDQRRIRYTPGGGS